MIQLAALSRSFEAAGLPEVSRCLTLTAAQPSLCSVRPERQIRQAEYYLRCHQRGEPGPMLEAAITRLVICALQIKSTSMEKAT